MTAVVLTGSGAVVQAAGDAPGDWFDPVAHLGPRGWKYLTPATRFLLAAAGRAIDDAGFDPQGLPDDSTGVAVGTNFAARPVVARLDEVVVADDAEGLSPAEAPNFSINLAASQISMRHGLRAFNLTLTDPVVAGVEALLTLAKAIRRGRAVAGVAGACEERHPGLPMREGACCFTLEAASHAGERGAASQVELVGGFSRFVPPGAAADVLETPLRALAGEAGGPLAFAGPPGDEPFGDRVASFCLSRPWLKLEQRPELVTDGAHMTVSPLLQLVGLLQGRGPGLLVAAGPHGHVAALYVR